MTTAPANSPLTPPMQIRHVEACPPKPLRPTHPPRKTAKWGAAPSLPKLREEGWPVDTASMDAPLSRGTGRHRAQIIYFFRMQIGSRARSGLGLVVGSRLYRTRHRCGSLVLSESPGSNPRPKDGQTEWSAEKSAKNA